MPEVLPVSHRVSALVFVKRPDKPVPRGKRNVGNAVEELLASGLPLEVLPEHAE